MLTVIFIVLVAADIVYSGNLPADWTCKPLTQTKAGLSDCAVGKFDGTSWSIDYGTVSGSVEFCTVGLAGAGVEYGKNFYVKAQFTRTPGGTGPFGGLAYNMDGVNKFNYIFMRNGVPSTNALEVGYNINGNKQPQGQQSDSVIADRSSTVLNLELLISKGAENIWINGQLKAGVSSIEPHFATPGPIGLFLFGKASRTGWKLNVNGLEICNPLTCTKDDGSKMQAGDTYINDDGKTCTCTAAGITCVCGSNTLTCTGGLTVWTDPDTCESKCITGPSYCSSSGDPHYRTFDGQYYDFHGECTYQAASCGDFKVFFENYDLGAVAPRYTGQMKLEYKGQLFVIKAGNIASVDGVNVVTPYRKDFTDGSYVLIQYNGAMEINLYSKGRSPSVRLIASNAGRYINAGMWLHGSCRDLTDGLCGNWNGIPSDDNNGQSWNDHSEHFKKFDNKCPKPPEPWHACDDVDDGYARASAICDVVLDKAPFTACHGAVDPAAVKANCQTDVCYCQIDKDCACSQYDNYASTCKNSGVNLDNWRNDVAYCPFDCPAGMAYDAKGADPAPTCQNKNPVQTGTHRGCFCPNGQYFQDGVCVTPDKCKCVHEGKIYNNGDSFKNEGKCLECTCADGGDMNCVDMVCPALDCAKDEIRSYKDDICCPYCNSDWVVAVNPDNQMDEGQDLVLTCDILAKGVLKKNIKWFKDGVVVKDTKNTDISNDKKQLKINSATAANSGTYSCQASLDGKVGKDDFKVDVIVPVRCTHEDGTKWEAGTVYNPTNNINCACDAQGDYKCECKVDDTPCKATENEWYNKACKKECVHKPGVCSAATDPHYTTFDGTNYDFQGLCIYKFFSGGGVEITADHANDGNVKGASAGTRSLDISYKTDTIHLGKGNVVLLNGGNIGVPFHKQFTDGSIIDITNTGNYIVKITEPGTDPLIELVWDKVNTYTITAHGSLFGKTDGLCGKWDDDTANDFTAANGKVIDSANDFAQTWSLEDEKDCPKPVPPPDACDGSPDMKKQATTYCKKVLSAGALGKCAKVIDQTEVLENCIQDSCTCWDVSCSCALIDVYADKCTAAKVDCDSWRLNNQASVCPPDCSSVKGTTFFAKGPKPAPTCGNPNPKGKKTQRGCFCPDGQVVEDNKCIDKTVCRCEYAGKFYNTGDKYDKEGACQSCICKAGGVAKCTKMKCTTKCGKNEIKVQEDNECCPVCYADWLTAVNPTNKINLNDDVSLTCKVKNGITVAAKDVKWYKLNPQKDAKTQKKVKQSKDGLVLTLSDVNNFRTGEWKCVVTKDGKKAEAKFSVETIINEGDLIAVEQKDFEFVAGDKTVTLKVKIEPGAKINKMGWSCNGKELTNGDGRFKFQQAGAYKTLIITNPTADDVGSCTATAYGVGEVDSETVNLKINAGGVTLTPVTPVKCKENKPGCEIKCKVTFTDGSKPNKANAGWYKVGANGKLGKKIAGTCNGGFFRKNFGNKTPKTAAGSYICKYTHKGKEYSADDPVVVQMDEQDTKVTLTPVTNNVKCTVNKKNCWLKCKIVMADGTKPTANNAAFYKDLGNGKLGPAITPVIKSGNMQKTFGNKTPASATGSYICRYTHKGTVYTSAKSFKIVVS